MAQTEDNEILEIKKELLTYLQKREGQSTYSNITPNPKYMYAEFKLMQESVDILKEIKTCPYVYQATSHHLADLIERGKPVPVWLKPYLVDILRGDIEEPKKNNRPKDEYVWRDLFICIAIAKLNTLAKSKNITIPVYTQNDYENESIILIVKDVLCEMGIDLSIDSITKIWKKGKEGVKKV